MKPAWHGWWRTVALFADTGSVALALGGAALLRFGPLRSFDLTSAGLNSEPLVDHMILAVPLWIASFAAFSLYKPARNMNPVEQARRLVAAGLAAPIALVSLSFAVRQEPSRLWIALSTLLVIPVVAFERRALDWFVSRRRVKGRWQTPVVVVGHREAKAVLEELVLNPIRGLQPVATCGFGWDGLPEGNFSELNYIVRMNQASAVVIVTTDMERDEVNHVVAIADQLPVQVLVLPGIDYTLAHNLAVVPVGEEPGLLLEPASLRIYQRIAKRTIDLLFSAAALLVTLPALLTIAFLIRIDSPGPALFKQVRVGRGGRVFTVFKFRTMLDGAEMRDDDEFGFVLQPADITRVTRVGRWLRRLSLDELPQFLNVLRGDMSIVGPRPLLGTGVVSDPVLACRLLMPPGMTGLWQIQRKSKTSPEELLRFDVTYTRNWSLLLDIYIILKTVPALIQKHHEH
jgi:exopolysaccharide biosynthesis polyprenyl glycosylphosphotransferase